MKDREIAANQAWVARNLVKVAGYFTVVGGIATIIGWATNTQRLTDWMNNGISMFANTALEAALSGAALLLVNRLERPARMGARVAGVLVALLGAMTLFEHLSGINLGIDTMLIRRTWGQNAADAPMRMGPPASLSFLMIGIAVLLLSFAGRARKVAVALGVMVMAISTLSLIGFVYGAHEMYMIPKLTGIAMQSAIMILTLGVGVAASAPECEPMRLLFEKSAAGLLARRALPIIVILSLSLGWLRVTIQRKGLVDTEFGTALRTVTEIALLTGLLWSAALMVRRHERALLQAKEAAEAANIAKDNFLAKLSHELRTPLTPVLAIISACENSPEFSNEMRDDMQTVRRNIELEARLIDDLLDLTRIVKGKLALNSEVLDVHRLTDQVVGMYRTELQSRKLDMTFRLDAPLHFVFADPGRFQQAIWNLLKNAAKFTPEGGSIEISTSNDANGRVLIAIRDSGIGIAPEAIGRLFKPFEQGSDEVVKRYGGLGLGLAIVKALLHAQAGEITAESNGVGHGATFTIMLPSVAEPAAIRMEALPEGAGSDDSRAFRLLLVEDHSDTARALSRQLRRNGHKVEIAESLRQAIEVFDPNWFDLVVSDIGLPDGTGLELMQHIREKYGPLPPALALTGYGMEEDIARCRAAGFSDHLTKPVNLQKLESAIQRLGGRNAGARTFDKSSEL